MRLLPYGPRAVLAEFDSLHEVMSASHRWSEAPLAGVVDVVPAARTVLVVHDGTLDAAHLASVLLTTPAAAAASSSVDDATLRGRDSVVVLDVVYDGIDLADVAARAHLTIDDVVALHTGAIYTVAFCGFMPGFAYLVGLPPELHLPRRPTPRTRVPEGAVAIAAEFAGVYPRESPGGWHLLGSTDSQLWDEMRDPPALLAPGTTVRFRPR